MGETEKVTALHEVSEDLVRRGPGESSRPRGIGFKQFGYGHLDRRVIELQADDAMGTDVPMLLEGYYGWIKLTHIKRGNPRMPVTMKKQPGYLLAGAHLKTERFPGNQEWNNALHEFGAVFRKRSKQWFVSLAPDPVQVHDFLIPLLKESMAQYAEHRARQTSRLREQGITMSEVIAKTKKK